MPEIHGPHRRIVVLGSTGSIGCQALDVIRANPHRFQLVGLGAGADGDALAEQASGFESVATGLGAAAAIDLAALPEADIVLNAIVGAAGLAASIGALEAGKILALANKESLVAGGEACLAAAKRGGGSIVPVDSEHAALAQVLVNLDRDAVARIVLTASGGPFRERRDMSDVTPDEALAHPTWSMGPKITVDSATLMNKGLEVIEAHHLFGFPYVDIAVLVHPQSIVHGMVELRDGTTLLQAAPPDMRIPIQAALGGDRFPSAIPTVDLAAVGTLSFEPVDGDRFPSVNLAYDAGRRARSYPAVLNAANEVAVHSFLERRISFDEIPRVVESVLEAHAPVDVGELDAVLAVDAWARRRAQEAIVREGVS
ncbi:MAG: 1-deoxy-D-xylulose-5-phosphate reductoisomerase [Actinomycetota bacterium]|jgi:1-deoxy-D-xylulose-5-phosphate reductoisomerase|nr:1-deoxy-D-xylulose-5-phosphate reductoisomerase [Actinomycetota bacterium]